MTSHSIPGHPTQEHDQDSVHVDLPGFNPCILIPVYNHHEYIGKTIDSLREHNISCILVDDGSHEACQRVLQDIAARESWVSLLRLDLNQGKGAAVCLGMRKAHQFGYTHALQIDSDGQHDVKCLPEFIQTSRQFQHAVVAGCRPYSEMPAKRRYGRMFTDVWVWINTLSTFLKDSMCGYRLYPLKETIELLNSTDIAKRMDFDTDILVRLYWNQVPIKQILTPVIYSSDIVSHFDLLNDNLRITRMHSKLFFGMLVRFPKLALNCIRNRQ